MPGVESMGNTRSERRACKTSPTRKIPHQVRSRRAAYVAIPTKETLLKEPGQPPVASRDGAVLAHL